MKDEDAEMWFVRYDDDDDEHMVLKDVRKFVEEYKKNKKKDENANKAGLYVKLHLKRKEEDARKERERKEKERRNKG